MIDLRALGRYRYALEEGGRPSDPYAVLLLCQHGCLYLHGPRTLGAATRSRGPVAKRLAALPFVRVVQDGSDGLNAVFGLAHFDAVAAVMRPRTRRQLSEPRRVKLVEAGLRFRYGAGDDCGERKTHVAGRIDPEAA